MDDKLYHVWLFSWGFMQITLQLTHCARFTDLTFARVLRLTDRRIGVMAEADITRYWCHECQQAVEEAMVEELKCPLCDGGFVEEMTVEQVEALTEQGATQWDPLDNPFEQAGSPGDSNDEDNSDIGREFEGFIRRHRRASALRRVLDSIHDDLRDDRERDNSVLISAFNQALALQGAALDPDEDRGDHGNANNDDGLLDEYVLGAGLSLLLQHLAENDPSRYGTPPTKKEAVEALPTVKIEEVVSCSVCLDDLDIGSQAKQLPCEHKFHSPCILPWLELHSSCPVCRFELPSDETKDLSEPSNVDRIESSHEEARADGPGNNGEDSNTNDREDSNRPWALVPWFNGLFSTPEPQTVRATLTDQQLPPASGTNPNAGHS
uniref:RING-type E3 ubiquitin transferase n=1 Tax=Aegilops tauschii subsp. strangulata TaxID=200361 RepID=A0A452ZDL8_AEGTS